MAKFIGRKIALGLKKESVRGTAETSATYWLPLTAKSYDDKPVPAVDESSVGIIEDSVESKITKKTAGGSLEGNVFDKSFGLLLYNVLGTVNSANHSGETLVKDHTFTVAETNQHQALTLLMDDPTTQDYKYALGMLETLEINAEAGKILTFKAGLRSKAGATATLTPSFTAENYFLSQHLTFKMATNLAGLAGASATYIKRANIKFNHNLEDDDVLGSIAPSDIVNTEFSCEGEVEMVFDSETFKTAMLADTAKALRFDWINTDITLGNATNPELKIDFAKVKFTELARKMDNKGLITQLVKFKALYSLTDSQMVQAILTNGETSY